MNAGDRLTGAHFGARVDHDLEDAAVFGDHEVRGIGAVHQACGGRLRRTLDHAEVMQQVAHAALGDGDRGRGRRAAAAELGEQEHLAQLLDRGVEHAQAVELVDDDAERRAKRQHRRPGARHLIRILEHVHAAERQEVQGLAAGMEVDHGIAQRQDAPGHAVGDHLGDGAVPPAREGAVQIDLVERRHARAGEHGRQVERR